MILFPRSLPLEHKPRGESSLRVFTRLHILQLMDKECYKDIEKIKTIGSTYMAAVGLVPTIGTKVEGLFGSVRTLE